MQKGKFESEFCLITLLKASERAKISMSLVFGGIKVERRRSLAIFFRLSQMDRWMDDVKRKISIVTNIISHSSGDNWSDTREQREWRECNPHTHIHKMHAKWVSANKPTTVECASAFFPNVVFQSSWSTFYKRCIGAKWSMWGMRINIATIINSSCSCNYVSKAQMKGVTCGFSHHHDHDHPSPIHSTHKVRFVISRTKATWSR